MINTLYLTQYTGNNYQTHEWIYCHSTCCAKSEILGVFYTLSMSCFGLGAFQVLSGSMWLVATTLDSAAPKHWATITTNPRTPILAGASDSLEVSESNSCSVPHHSREALRVHCCVHANNVILKLSPPYLLYQNAFKSFYFRLAHINDVPSLKQAPISPFYKEGNKNSYKFCDFFKGAQQR